METVPSRRLGFLQTHCLSFALNCFPQACTAYRCSNEGPSRTLISLCWLLEKYSGALLFIYLFNVNLAIVQLLWTYHGI